MRAGEVPLDSASMDRTGVSAWKPARNGVLVRPSKTPHQRPAQRPADSAMGSHSKVLFQREVLPISKVPVKMRGFGIRR
jgi:hypothetical protein